MNTEIISLLFVLLFELSYIAGSVLLPEDKFTRDEVAQEFPTAVSSSGQFCKCDQTSAIFGYTFCYLEGSWHWDYCSSQVGVDAYGKECLDTFPCDFHGESYQWCRHTLGWGKCGGFWTSDLKFFSESEGACVGPCEHMDNTGKYYCFDDRNHWSPCSPFVDTTFTGRPCRADHFCGKHFSSIWNWCYTDDDDEWEYCSLVEHESEQQRKNVSDGKRDHKSIPQWRDFYEILDHGNRLRITFSATTEGRVTPPSSGQRRAASQAINWWHRQTRPPHLPGELPPVVGGIVRPGPITLYPGVSNGVRLDSQTGYFQRECNLYCNLQLQTNGANSQTVAALIIPVEIAERLPRYVERGLLMSMFFGMTVVVQVHQWNPKLASQDDWICFPVENF